MTDQLVSSEVNFPKTFSNFLKQSVGGSLQEALTFGCRVAGRKCGFHGYEGISKDFTK